MQSPLTNEVAIISAICILARGAVVFCALRDKGKVAFWYAASDGHNCVNQL